VKRTQLRRLAVRWLAAHGVPSGQVRIDVLGFTAELGGYTIEHIRGCSPALPVKVAGSAEQEFRHAQA
jgi:hypothetical protein